MDLAAGTVRIRRDKAGEGRWAVLNSALLIVKKDRRVLGPFVFCSPEGKALYNFERIWKPTLQAA